MDAATIQRRRWAILGVMMICLLVVVLDNTILNVALRTIQSDLNASQSQMQWAVDSYALVFAGLLIPFGVLGDRLGRKRMLVFGMVVFGATSALCSTADSATQLILYRALMGIGAAAVQPQTLSIIQNVFEPAERGKAIGIWAAAAGSAIAIGPLVGGALLKYFWWGSVFLVNVPVVVIGVIAIAFLVPDSRDPKPGKLDPAGIVLSFGALTLLVYGIIEGGNSNRWLTLNALGAIVAGVALLAVFVYVENHLDHPTIDMALFKNRHFAAGTVAVGLAFFALSGATFFLSYFLQAVRGYTPLASGVALVAVAAAQLIAAPRSAKFSARFGTRTVSATGFALTGVSLCCYALLNQGTQQWVVEIVMFGLGFGLGLGMAPATNAVMGAVARERAGAGSAVNNTVRQVGAALGVAVLGSLLAVIYRGDLGAGTPAGLARTLDRPAAVLSQLPASQQVSPLVRTDTSQSIGNSLDFVQQAATVLRARPEASAAGQAQAVQALDAFAQKSKNSFVSAMHITSFVAGLVAIVGAVVAFLFLPGRPKASDQVASRLPAEAVAAVGH